MQPYYERSGISIHNAKAEALLASLPAASVDLIVTDPPYFRVKGAWWDRQWDSAAGFLAWLDTILEACARVLKPNGSLYVFASPQMAARVEVLTGERFNVLNSIRWRKEGDNSIRRHVAQLAEKGLDRSFYPEGESVVFAEARGDDYEDACKELRRRVFFPIGDYFRAEREAVGLTRSEAEVALGFVLSSDPTRGTALYTRWEEAASLPTLKTYKQMRALWPGRFVRPHEALRADYDALRADYERLRGDFEALRRPFNTSGGPVTDIWHFPPVAPYPGKHECEKPAALIDHIIRASSRPGDTVADFFLGSGVTAERAFILGRSFVGSEVQAKWCERAAHRVDGARVPLFEEAEPSGDTLSSPEQLDLALHP